MNVVEAYNTNIEDLRINYTITTSVIRKNKTLFPTINIYPQFPCHRTPISIMY